MGLSLPHPSLKKVGGHWPFLPLFVPTLPCYALSSSTMPDLPWICLYKPFMHLLLDSQRSEPRLCVQKLVAFQPSLVVWPWLFSSASHSSDIIVSGKFIHKSDLLFMNFAQHKPVWLKHKSHVEDIAGWWEALFSCCHLFLPIISLSIDRINC